MVSTSTTPKQHNHKRQTSSMNTTSQNISKHKNGASKTKPDEKRKKKNESELSSRGSNSTGARHSTQSDMSADEADTLQPELPRRRSQVHSFADKVSDTEYKCGICGKVCHENKLKIMYFIEYAFGLMQVIRCGRDTNSNIRRHLGIAHGMHHLMSKSHQVQFSTTNIGAQRKRTLDDAAMKCIIRDGHPFEDFRKPGMIEFLATVASGYSGPHSQTVRRNIRRLYTSKLFELCKQLQPIRYVALTTDLWKRPSRQHHYLGVTVHFVDKEFQSVSKILSFRRFHGRHLAKRIRSHLIRIVHKYVNEQ